MIAYANVHLDGDISFWSEGHITKFKGAHEHERTIFIVSNTFSVYAKLTKVPITFKVD